MDPETTDAAEPLRTLPLTGAFNFRDLGGYRTTAGKRVRWRTLFRADGLGDLTIADVDALRDIGLRTVVDLRLAHELANGTFPVDLHPVAFHHVSILDQSWDHEQALKENLPTAEFLHRAYTAMLDAGADQFAEAFRILAGAEALPAVFHCAAGKDRTGILAVLILGALGVERDLIVADYALTQAAMERILGRLAQDPERKARIDRSPRSFFVADGDAVARLLDDIERAHGSVRGFVRHLGVPAADLDGLEAHLLA